MPLPPPPVKPDPSRPQTEREVREDLAAIAGGYAQMAGFALLMIMMQSDWVLEVLALRRVSS